MKKGGKKWRKLQKEKEERKANIKVVEPFSKERTRKHICLHYDGTPGGILIGDCYSLLYPINESECKCNRCGKVFSIDKYRQMEWLVDYMSNKGCVTDVAVISELSKGLEPVHYRRLSETETEILDTMDELVLPPHTCVIINSKDARDENMDE